MKPACLQLIDGTLLRVSRGTHGECLLSLAGDYGDGARWVGDRLPNPAAFWRGEPVAASQFADVAERIPHWPMPGELLPDVRGGGVA